MTDSPTDFAAFESEEEELVLPRFDHEDAWRLGSAIRAEAAAAGLGVAIDIRRPAGAVLFHTALAGATADQDDWIARKSAVVLRFEVSSALATARMVAVGIPEGTSGSLDASRFVFAGGAVPIRVAGAGVVAVLTVSGLTSAKDHALAVNGLRVLLAHMID